MKAGVWEADFDLSDTLDTEMGRTMKESFILQVWENLLFCAFEWIYLKCISK